MKKRRVPARGASARGNGRPPDADAHENGAREQGRPSVAHPRRKGHDLAPAAEADRSAERSRRHRADFDRRHAVHRRGDGRQPRRGRIGVHRAHVHDALAFLGIVLRRDDGILRAGRAPSRSEARERGEIRAAAIVRGDAAFLGRAPRRRFLNQRTASFLARRKRGHRGKRDGVFPDFRSGAPGDAAQFFGGKHAAQQREHAGSRRAERADVPAGRRLQLAAHFPVAGNFRHGPPPLRSRREHGRRGSGAGNGARGSGRRRGDALVSLLPLGGSEARGNARALPSAEKMP